MNDPIHLPLPAGAPIFLHQAFTCCPYAAIVTARIHDFLEVNGFQVCDQPEDAAAAVINTCGFNASRAEQALRAIRTVRRRAGDAPLVVSGCLTRIERERIQAALEGLSRTALVGPAEHGDFDRLFGAPHRPFARVRTHEYNERYSARDPRLGLYQVLVATGCRNECRYCVIRHAKGGVASQPISRVVEQVRDGIAAGHREVFLVADDLSSYGHDLGTDLGELLRALVPLDVRYSAEAFEPSRLLAQLERVQPALESGRFDWIVVPVQSGSDLMLRRMGRRYARADVERLLGRLRQFAPRMIVSTDILFGYPGEEDGDFEASLSLADLFDHASFNEYEARPGTPPVTADEACLRRRREAVQIAQRRKGGQLDRLTARRAAACATWSGDGPVGGEPPPDRWARIHAERVTRDLGGLGRPLAGGWSLECVRPHRRSVSLELRRPRDGGTMEVMLSPRDPDRGVMAEVGEYGLSLLSETPLDGLSSDRSRALDDLLRHLGGGTGGPGGEPDDG